MVGVVALVAVKLGVLAASAGRWGFHRDEPYYVVCGEHLDWGYVDHPPITPALARFAHAVAGSSLAVFRLLPMLVSSALLVVAAVTARELGGTGSAAFLAALATLACPVLLVSGHWFQTVPFDQLLGALAVLIWAHIVAGGDGPWWIGLGLVVGIGLETKWTMLLVAAAVTLGTLAHSDLHSQLTTPWPWGGAATALSIWVPHLLWQMKQGWPTLDFIRNNRAAARGRFVWQQLGVVGAPLLVLATAGLVWCWQRSAWRPAALGIGAVLVALAVIGAKPYYHGPLLPFLFAAGSIAVDEWGVARLLIIGCIAAWGALALVFTLPVLSPSRAAGTGVLSVNAELAEEIGWPALTEQVARVIGRLPSAERPSVRVLTRSYGEAAAIEILGPSRGIARGTALSGHNSYATWWPISALEGPVVSVRFQPAELATYFEDCQIVDEVRNCYHVRNQLAGAPIMVCRGLQVSPVQLRDALRVIR